MSYSESSSEIIDSVQNLYRVFKPYKTRSHPHGCPCCVTDEDNGKLFSKPLEKLTPDDLGRFAWKAITTWGSEEDLKHFLPRLLELVATDDCNTFQREVLFGKLRLAEWRTWPANEQRAVEEFLEAVWWDCLSSDEGNIWAHELLCGLGQALEDLTPYLHKWTACRMHTGYDYLAEFIDENSETVIKWKTLSNEFWSDAEPQMRQVVAWLTSSKTLQSLKDLLEDEPYAEFSESLAIAIENLSLLQDSLNIH